jgi:glucose-1-phosphate thymidylyltransferase
MIYYALSDLLLAGITKIAIVTNLEFIDNYFSLLGYGDKFGCEFSYFSQSKPRGIAEALLICEKFLDGDRVCLHLGDNIFYGSKLSYFLQTAQRLADGAIVFSIPVKNPQDFGVAEVGENGKIVAMVEKPTNPKSNLAIPGIYFLDGDASKMAKELKPSARGELEITELLDKYLKEKNILVLQLGRGMMWMDAGNWETLLDTSSFVRAIEERTGTMIGCPEEVALRMGYITNAHLVQSLKSYPNGAYKSYLERLLQEVQSGVKDTETL